MQWHSHLQCQELAGVERHRGPVAEIGNRFSRMYHPSLLIWPALPLLCQHRQSSCCQDTGWASSVLKHLKLMQRDAKQRACTRSMLLSKGQWLDQPGCRALSTGRNALRMADQHQILSNALGLKTPSSLLSHFTNNEATCLSIVSLFHNCWEDAAIARSSYGWSSTTATQLN